MSTRTRWLTFLAATAFIVSGIAFLAVSTTSHSAAYLSHGGNASSIPYAATEFDYIESLDYTDYDDLHENAIVGWFYMSYPDVFITTWESGGDMREYVVYSGSTDDTNLANYFSVDSCEDYNENYQAAYESRSFMYGHTSYGGDKRFTVICINHSSYDDFPYAFDDLDGYPSTQTIGYQHEIGHALHLAHYTGEGAMDTCWCYTLDSNEVDYVADGYAAGH